MQFDHALNWVTVFGHNDKCGRSKNGKVGSTEKCRNSITLTCNPFPELSITTEIYVVYELKRLVQCFEVFLL